MTPSRYTKRLFEKPNLKIAGVVLLLLLLSRFVVQCQPKPYSQYNLKLPVVCW